MLQALTDMFRTIVGWFMSLLHWFSFERIQHWISTKGFGGGVLIMFSLLFACGLGLPLPEDVPLVIGGALLCTDKKSWAIVAIAAWCGIIGGDIMLYMLGRKFGRGITRLPLIGKHVTNSRLDRVEALFEQYGVGVVGIGRMVAGIRGAMVVCAGTIRFNFVKFLIADGMGAVVSGGLFLLLGHWIGVELGDAAAKKKIHEFKELFIIGAAILIGALIFYIQWKKRNRHKMHIAQEKVVEKVAAAEKKVTDKIVETAEKIVKKPEQPTEPPKLDPSAPPPPSDKISSDVDGSAGSA